MQYKRFNRKTVDSQGMVLVTVLLLLALMNIVMGYLFGRLPFYLQLGNHWFTEAQQFEAAEAGLRYGEHYLTQSIDKAGQTQQPIPTIPALDYANYRVNITTRVMPHTFCLSPMHQAGHYYQITANATPRNSRYKSIIRLQSTIALPNGSVCDSDHVTRWAGRNAWCQLTVD